MEPISSMGPAAVYQRAAAEDVKENPKTQQPEDGAQEGPGKPRRDEYIPEKKASGNQEEKCTGSTDKVDREIEKLKKKQQELEQRLNTETDDTKIRELERKLAQVERELAQKDNDTYRRQHTVFSSF